jgi:ABC-2 type transport system ATP-binding protein
MLAVAARGIQKRYTGPFGRGGQWALRSVDLEVPRGIAFGLIGLNGAGKTTFVKTLLGVVKPTAGELGVLGGVPRDVSVRARIGYVPERLALPGAWTARAFLGSVARLKRVPHPEPEVTRQLGRVGLGGHGSERIGKFSKGMRQRLALAAALIGAPELLVLDEPTDGVDPLGRIEIRGILSEERARGATLFINSHLLSETERMCDRIGILSSGEIVRQGTMVELCGTEGAWRVRFAPGAESAVQALGFEPTGDGCHRCRAPTPQALNALLDAARAEGALLVELGPDQRDLEQVLAEVYQP